MKFKNECVSYKLKYVNCNFKIKVMYEDIID
jgi:hypothetical protein